MMLSVNCCESWDHVIGNTPYRNIYLYIYPIGKYIYIPYRNIYIYTLEEYIYIYTLLLKTWYLLELKH